MAVWLLLCCCSMVLVAPVVGRTLEAQAFLPVGVTTELEDSPVSIAATEVSWQPGVIVLNCHTAHPWLQLCLKNCVISTRTYNVVMCCGTEYKRALPTKLAAGSAAAHIQVLVQCSSQSRCSCNLLPELCSRPIFSLQTVGLRSSRCTQQRYAHALLHAEQHRLQVLYCAPEQPAAC